jgi:hypothetical protein
MISPISGRKHDKGQSFGVRALLSAIAQVLLGMQVRARNNNARFAQETGSDFNHRIVVSMEQDARHCWGDTVGTAQPVSWQQASLACG